MKYPSASDLIAIENVNIYMSYPAGYERKPCNLKSYSFLRKFLTY